MQKSRKFLVSTSPPPKPTSNNLFWLGKCATWWPNKKLFFLQKWSVFIKNIKLLPIVLRFDSQAHCCSFSHEELYFLMRFHPPLNEEILVRDHSSPWSSTHSWLELILSPTKNMQSSWIIKNILKQSGKWFTHQRKKPLEILNLYSD